MIGFFCGRVRLRGGQRFAVKLLNLCMRFEIPYGSYRVCDGFFFIDMTERSAVRLIRLADDEGIVLEVVSRDGLPQLWRQYGRRFGLAVGAVLCCLLLFLSSRVVWDVRITGNRELGREEIRQMLSSCGLDVGTYLPTLDTDLVETRLLLSHKELCWVSVNVRGTTANVELLETGRGAERSDGYANLVASRDGTVERIESYDGNVCVRVGDVVGAGDLLVSGIYDSLRATRASGKIYARTVHQFDVEIPLKSTQKVYTGREWSEKYVNFFAKHIKVFSNTGNAGAFCDIIYHNNGIVLPNGVSLPVGVRSVVYREYREETVNRTEREAMNAAFDQLSEELSVFVSETGAELLEKSVTFSLDAHAYRLQCTVVCIENIALTREFDMN